MEIPLSAFISAYSIALPFIIGIILIKELKNEYKLFVILLGYGLSIEIIGLFTKNLWMMNIWDILEFSCLAYIFSKIPFLKKIKQLIIYSILVNLILRIIFLALQIDSLTNFTSNITIVTSFILILLSMYTLFKLSKETRKLIHKYYLFWFLIGIALYFTGTIFILLISLFVDPEHLFEIYIIHSFTNIISNLIFTCSIILQYKNSKQRLSI